MVTFVYLVTANLPDKPTVQVWEPASAYGQVAWMSGDEFNMFRALCARLGVQLVEANDWAKAQLEGKPNC